MENKKIRLTDGGLQYKRVFKWVMVPYEEIAQAYMRVEEVNTKMGRGTTNFNLHFLMLKKTDGSLLKLGVLHRTVVQEVLEQLRQKNDKIEFGYKQSTKSEDAPMEEGDGQANDEK